MQQGSMVTVLISVVNNYLFTIGAPISIFIRMNSESGSCMKMTEPASLCFGSERERNALEFQFIGIMAGSVLETNSATIGFNPIHHFLNQQIASVGILKYFIPIQRLISNDMTITDSVNTMLLLRCVFHVVFQRMCSTMHRVSVKSRF